MSAFPLPANGGVDVSLTESPPRGGDGAKTQHWVWDARFARSPNGQVTRV